MCNLKVVSSFCNFPCNIFNTNYGWMQVIETSETEPWMRMQSNSWSQIQRGNLVFIVVVVFWGGCLSFETGSHHVTHTDLELNMQPRLASTQDLLHRSPKHWDYRSVSPGLSWRIILTKARKKQHIQNKIASQISWFLFKNIEDLKLAGWNI